MHSDYAVAMSRAALRAVSLLVAAAPCAHAAESNAFSRGDRIAATCVTCHHPANTHIPPLAGTSAALLSALTATEDTIMHRLLAGLTEEDIEAVAGSLARTGGDAP